MLFEINLESGEKMIKDHTKRVALVSAMLAIAAIPAGYLVWHSQMYFGLLVLQVGIVSAGIVSEHFESK